MFIGGFVAKTNSVVWRDCYAIFTKPPSAIPPYNFVTNPFSAPSANFAFKPVWCLAAGGAETDPPTIRDHQRDPWLKRIR